MISMRMRSEFVRIPWYDAEPMTFARDLWSAWQDGAGAVCEHVGFRYFRHYSRAGPGSHFDLLLVQFHLLQIQQGKKKKKVT